MSTRAMSVASVIATHLPEPPHAPGVSLCELGRGGHRYGARVSRGIDGGIGGAIGRRLARDPEDHGARDQEEEPGAAVQRQADA